MQKTHRDKRPNQDCPKQPALNRRASELDNPGCDNSHHGWLKNRKRIVDRGQLPVGEIELAEHNHDGGSGNNKCQTR